jgi:hypothetical protein
VYAHSPEHFAQLYAAGSIFIAHTHDQAIPTVVYSPGLNKAILAVTTRRKLFYCPLPA